MKVTSTELKELLPITIKSGLVPAIFGSPGIGKSDIVKAFAEKNKLKLIDVRLSQLDPTALLGFPYINKDNKAAFTPPSMFPIESDPIPEGYKGWLVFMDEITSAPPAIQASAYKIILDRQVESYKLHDRVIMVAAGNTISDNAVAYRMSTALQSRLIHYELELDTDAWFEWAKKAKIHTDVIYFLKHRPELLHKFDPNHDDYTFPTGRTWEFVSKQLKHIKGKPDYKHLPLIAGTVGEGAANEFISYCKNFSSLPTIDQIKKNPDKVSIPDEPSKLYALSSLIIQAVNDDITMYRRVAKLLNKFSTDLHYSILLDIVENCPDVINEESAIKFINDEMYPLLG